VNTITSAIVPEELLAMRASLRQASALAGLLVEVRKCGVDLGTVVARDTFASTTFEIPSLACLTSLWLALASTGVAVPYINVVFV